MNKEQDKKPQDNGRQAKTQAPWYAGPYKDALTYCMVALFLVELIVGGVAFFYGLVHAVPETPGGPPLARFPWLGWSLAAVLAPVALLLIVHLAGTWVAHMLGREDGAASGTADSHVPPQVQRLYAIIRNAPTVVLLLGILLLGAALFFVDGAFSAVMRLGTALLPYIPWLAGSFAALLAVCYLGQRWFVYRQQRMQEEYAWRRQVLERTGIVLMDKSSLPLPGHGPESLQGRVLEAQALPCAEDTEQPNQACTPADAQAVDQDAQPASHEDAEGLATETPRER